MAWELTLSKSVSIIDSEDDIYEPLGVSMEDLRKIIDSYFPDVEWSGLAKGIWSDDEGGEVEFELDGEPPTYVRLRVHDAAPSLQLLALANEMKWGVLNDSTGDSLADEAEIDEKRLAQVQKKARAARKKSVEASQKPKAKRLPRILSAVPLMEVEAKYGVSKNTYFLLSHEEVTRDVFDEFFALMRDDPRYLPLRYHPLGSSREIQLPNKERLGELTLRYDTPEGEQFFKDYLAKSGRRVARVEGDRVIMADGTAWDAKACMYLERPMRRYK